MSKEDTYIESCDACKHLKKSTRRLCNLQSPIMFRPRSLTFLTKLNTKRGKDKKLCSKIAQLFFRKQFVYQEKNCFKLKPLNELNKAALNAR